MAPSAKAELTSDMVAKSKAFKEQYIHMFGTNKYTKRGPHSNAKLSRKNVVSRQGPYSTMLVIFLSRLQWLKSSSQVA